MPCVCVRALFRYLLLTAISLVTIAPLQAEQCEQRETVLKYLALDKTFDDWFDRCTSNSFSNLNDDQTMTVCNCITEHFLTTVREHFVSLPSGTNVCGSDTASLFNTDARTDITQKCLTQFNNSN